MDGAVRSGTTSGRKIQAIGRRRSASRRSRATAHAGRTIVEIQIALPLNFSFAYRGPVYLGTPTAHHDGLRTERLVLHSAARRLAPLTLRVVCRAHRRTLVMAASLTNSATPTSRALLRTGLLPTVALCACGGSLAAHSALEESGVASAPRRLANSPTEDRGPKEYQRRLAMASRHGRTSSIGVVRPATCVAWGTDPGWRGRRPLARVWGGALRRSGFAHGPMIGMLRVVFVETTR